MITISEYLKQNTLVTDGAMGTYYAELTADPYQLSELANLHHPEIISRIHNEYIAAGARLIRTNTFAANRYALGLSQSETATLIRAGYRIAAQAAQDHQVYVAANIGPINDGVAENDQQLFQEYQSIIDTFLEAGATTFTFETFSNLNYLSQITEYLKKQQPDAFVLSQFTITADGFTRKGLSAKKIIETVKDLETVEAYGFNCGAGPTHLYNILKQFDFTGAIVSALPNAGYPEIINERTIYNHNPAYFGRKLLELKNLGLKIIGGCCGTTPAHIRETVLRLNATTSRTPNSIAVTVNPEPKPAPVKNEFAEKLGRGKLVIAVELDPPFDANPGKILEGARVYHDHGVDLVTVADSPMAKARVDSIALAAKIKREIGIETLPHVCCRDKNMNALKSSLLAAHIEGIRNILAVTGDPMSSSDRNSIKSVFNLNSVELIEFITEMNAAIFPEDQLVIGGALNINAHNQQAELLRLEKKLNRGASFFLTQPVFTDAAIQFLAEIKKRYPIKVLGGIIPLVNYKNAHFLNNEVSGISIPDSYLSRFTETMDRETAENTGIELAVAIAAKMKPFVDGYYLITPFNRTGMIVKIINRLDSAPPEKRP